ncbi:MAG: type II toxin-antitoxin system death-on-curing family toxin [Patescibacteria group bacterium]
MRTHYPKDIEVLALHYAIVEKTGGSQGVRDLHLFASLIEKPKASFGGVEMYPTLFAKAAVHLEGFAAYHVFIDGSKRTAFAVAKRFLHINGVDFKPRHNDVEEFMVAVVEKKLKIPSIATWLEENSKKE